MGLRLYRIENAWCAEAAGSFRESFANFVGEPQATVARCSGKCERCCVYIGARANLRPYRCVGGAIKTEEPAGRRRYEYPVSTGCSRPGEQEQG